MLLHLNLAYFLPSLPTLLLQSVWDARLDSRYGTAKAATFRLGIGEAALWHIGKTLEPIQHMLF